MKNRRHILVALISPALSLVLLCGVAYSLQKRQPPEGVVAYHDQIQRLGLDVPRLIGEWLGEDTAVPAPALDILKPNVMLSRHYQNIRTGQGVTMVLTQVRDAFTMTHHHPPACYRYAGWTLDTNTPGDWKAAGVTVPVNQYEFRRENFEGESRLMVVNFMAVPGQYTREMKRVVDNSYDPVRNLYGACQVQLLFDVRSTVEERQAIFADLVSGLMPVLDEVVNGVNQDE